MSATSGRDRLRSSYALAAALALLGLCPQLLLSTASAPLRDLLTQRLSCGPQAVQLAEGMSDAAYALGALVAAQLAIRVAQRRPFLAYQATFVVGAVVAVVASGPGVYLVGRVLMGAATGSMLISALPPLLVRFGVARLPLTVVIINVGVLGASTLGPIVGGVVAAHDAVVVLFALLATAGALGWVAALLGYPATEAPEPDATVDRSALLLATVTTGATFLGTSMLTSHSLGSPWFVVPFAVGLLALVALVLTERRKEDPLVPVASLSTQLPVTGTGVAMVAGAVFVTTIQLVQTYLADVAHRSPGSAARLFWPAPLGLVVAAVLFGLLLRTRFVPLLVDLGLVSLGLGAALLLALTPADTGILTCLAVGLLGFGAGATVSPGLLLTGFGLPARSLARAFALVQLLRSVATYAVAPVVLHIAEVSVGLPAGVHTGLWVMVGLSGAGLVLALVVPLLSGARLRVPDIETWLAGDDAALPSPATGSRVRPAG